ncbi:hypothetical protein PGT21_033836 [Puccinia graminis f. sp. tritici]|uniref:Uncharacterized protein n=1 Tax=Puccinia graminis f. sp. tritici TaxID=56615 RepID=A0A5B0N930_PUCGR|nr:hypothetical protein PGTUg99_010056 [Puccinia graminis f. sp. tritici]KAA1084668.1 hypothetical protein PGT21_033836 [Puccinia graminis f. sp. tritici]
MTAWSGLVDVSAVEPICWVATYGKTAVDPGQTEHLQQSRDWAIFSPNQWLAGEFWGPAEPQLDPQLIAPHLTPGYKPKSIAAVAETGYSLLGVFLTTHPHDTHRDT